MSVAYDLEFASPQPLAQPRQRPRPLELVPSTGVPMPVRRPVRPVSPRPAAVPGLAVLRPLDDPASLRLTRRGVSVVSALALAVGLAIAVLGALSAHPSGAAPQHVGPAVVTVHAGDTLWSIASSAAPGQDPRTEIADIEGLNGLRGEAIVPGQRLRLH